MDTTTQTQANQGNPTNESEKARQAHIISSMGIYTQNPQIVQFPRFSAFVLGQDCRDIHPNGHITQDNAVFCGTNRIMEALEVIPGTIDPEAVEALKTVEIRTFPRFSCQTSQGTQKCAFGHRDFQTAQKCLGQGKTSQKAVKATIKVIVGGTTPEQDTTTQTTPKAPEAPKPTQTPQRKSKLTSGAQGTVGGKTNQTTQK